MAEMVGRRLHFVAIGGAGMSGLALVCHRLGAEVTGSDRSESAQLGRLRSAGLEPAIGHDAGAVPPDAELVVSTAVPDDNPEVAIARRRGQGVMHRGELLAEVSEMRRLIAVSGTHGKTTTAGMVAWILMRAGSGSFLLGGELPGAGPGGEPTNAAWSEGEWLVVEADESDASFLRLRPEVAVVTNVELDHHSRWSSRTELIEAFRRFADGSDRLALLDEPALDPIAGRRQALRFGGGLLPPPRPEDRPPSWVPDPGPDLAVPGVHNMLNAHAALAAVELSGIDGAAGAEALADFPGMLRRLERKGTSRGAVVYDDYAHHPTEVRAALAALRKLGPRRLIAIFQPHLYSRTRALAEELGAALTVADEVGVLDVYPAREEPVGPLAGVSGLDVARAAAERSGGRPVWWLADVDAAAGAIAPRLEPGDLLVTLGAGDVFELADRLVRANRTEVTR